MSTDTVSTRRSLLKGGALLAAPLAGAGAAVAIAEQDHKTRLARLEDEAAIRTLHQAWLRRINTGATEEAAQLFADPARARFNSDVQSLAADPAGAPDAIAVSADGQSATGRFHCAVDIETAIPRDSTLAQMAHAQGGGFVRATERRLLKADYVKASGAWAIARLEFDEA